MAPWSHLNDSPVWKLSEFGHFRTIDPVRIGQVLRLVSHSRVKPRKIGLPMVVHNFLFF